MTPIYVQLGRYGDVLGFLPVLYHKHLTTGVKPRLLIAEEFADLLEGVTYVEPLIFQGHRDDLATAIKAARAFGNPINAQVSGTGVRKIQRTECFMRDSWALVRADHRWDQLSLVIDAREPFAEAELADQVIGSTKRPVVLVASGSHSSPFDASTLEPLLEDLRKDFHVVDITNVKARRLYDLLGLFDRAHALISVDTSVLHLADASNIPVVAIVNPKPWYGSLRRSNHIHHTTYDRIDVDAIASAVRDMLPRTRKFHHVYPTWDDVDRSTTARQVVAARSWHAVGDDWFHHAHCPDRTSADIGDHACLPFVKDMIDHGMSRCKSLDDVVVLTNSDVGLVPETTHYMRSLANRGALFSYRFNHKRITGPIVRMANLRGTWDGGLDLFAFTKSWWIQHSSEFPDMVMGAPKWDLVYRDIIKRLGGAELHGCVFHEMHRSRWQDDPHPVSTVYNERIWKRHTAKNDPTRCYQ